ncbi:MAG: helix-turn-helix transcriptional regulator [Roseivirga sp.]|nr:helix-turn-helix transcriptional regulator [Roseivirga sp.]
MGLNLVDRPKPVLFHIMDSLGWEAIIIVFGIVQAVSLGLLLLISRKRPLSAALFGALLIIEAFGLLEQFLYFSKIVYQVPNLLGWSYPFNIIKPALLLLFVNAYFLKGFWLQKKHLLHLIPFVVYLLLFIPLFTATEEQKVNFLNSMQDDVWTDNLQGIIFFAINSLIHIVYFVYTLSIVRKSHDLVIRSNDITSLWVSRLVVFFATFFVFRIVLYFFNGFHLLSNQTFATIVMLISSFTIQCIAWFLLRNMRWPNFKPEDIPSMKEIDLLTKVLNEEKAYLDDALTLEKLAKSAGLTAERVTNLFRVFYKKPFKETINTLRIEEAKRLIKENGPKQLNLLAIAMDSGFNNKVTFYRAFKKNEDCSPSEYVKSLFSPSLSDHLS